MSEPAGLPGPGALAAMPLHVITSMYGEPGLRAGLAAEIPGLGGVGGPVASALDLASELHAGDRRQSEPYANHLLRVSLRIIRWGIRDPEVTAGALAVLASRFGERTAALVAAVTNPPRVPGAGDAERRRQYLEHVTNGAGLMWTSGPAVTRLAAKYAPLVPVLAGFAARPDTPLPAPARERVLRQLGQAGQRFTAILADAG